MSPPSRPGAIISSKPRRSAPASSPGGTSERNSEPSSLTGASSTGGVPVAPGLGALGVGGPETRGVDRRTAVISALAILIALGAGVVAQMLTRLIGFFTNLAFYGRWSTQFTSPAQNHLGLGVLAVPVLGGVVVGLMARYGHAGIRGHGIPETMERILTNQSRISPRIIVLKPLSAAIAIGTGGPFGAEGPIIATGGAFGSLVGQLLPVTVTER